MRQWRWQMLNFMELAKSRHSVRNYKQTKVEKAKEELILESGRIAPTAVNNQPCKFLVLNSEAALDKLSLACNYHKAPLVIIVCADKNIAWKRPIDNHSMVDIDATIATTHMMLCAEDLDLSSCWITNFKPEVVVEQFNVPENLIPVNILEIGYSNEEEKSPDRYQQDRKPLASFVCYDSF